MSDRDRNEREEEHRAASQEGPGAGEAPAGAEGAEPREAGEAPAEGQADLAELERRYLYLAAEFENFKKRAERRLREALEFATEDLLRDLLPVLDNLERAVDHAKESGPEGYPALIEGLEHVITQFRQVLEKHGVEEVPGEGERFDPNVHEAMLQVPGEESGRVHQVFEKGYRLKGRLLRPAKVSVTKVAPPQGDG